MELPDARLAVAQTRPAKASHGRYETRTLWAIASPSLNAYAGSSGDRGVAWPGLAQVCRIQRVVHRRSRKTGEWLQHAEVAYAVTSLAPARATAGQLLRRWRGHWGIESAPRSAEGENSKRESCQEWAVWLGGQAWGTEAAPGLKLPRQCGSWDPSVPVCC